MCDRPCLPTSACRRCDPTGSRCEGCVLARYGEHCLFAGCVLARYGEHCLFAGCVPGRHGCVLARYGKHCLFAGCVLARYGEHCSFAGCVLGRHGEHCLFAGCVLGRHGCVLTRYGEHCLFAGCVLARHGEHCLFAGCVPGRYGEHCLFAGCVLARYGCVLGRYGEHCLFAGCVPGRYGEHCLFGRCALARYGCVLARYGEHCLFAGCVPGRYGCVLARYGEHYLFAGCVLDRYGEHCLFAGCVLGRHGCVLGRHGEHCLSLCGKCYNNRGCDKLTGECPVTDGLRCQAGYTGLPCLNQCLAGKWGTNCASSCGQCYNDTVCDRTSGECTLSAGNPRCAAGYKGSLCVQPCTDGMWGADCKTPCGNCNNGTVCDKTSGVCPVIEGNPRCSAGYGYTDTTCRTLTAMEITVSQDSSTGKIAGGIVGALFLVAVVVFVIMYRRRSSSASNDRKISFSRNPVGRPEDQFAHVDTLGNRRLGVDNVPVQMNEADDALPYDHSRVILKPSDTKGESDYINASYINGFEKPKTFIASQGPTDLIINDFMRMLWEQNVGIVVMVTNLVENTKKKCNQYWPTEGSTKFGVIEVTLLDELIYANYNIRTLQLSAGMNKPKILKQFHFTAWPDHGTPSGASVLLDFREKVVEHSSNLPGPIVVHCSAGIGRTGTFIALDYLVNQAKAEGMVDVPACVELLRQQRVNMVQTQEQYEFLHEALAEALKLSHRSIPSMSFSAVYSDLCILDPITGQPKLAAQFKILEEVTPTLDKASQKTARLEENLPKNRNQILAVDRYRPYLSTPVSGCNDYINAVFLPGYRKKRGFILTQTPLPITVVDFWRLVYDHGVRTIVMFDHAYPRDKNVGIYWTDQKGTFGPFETEVTDVDQREGFSAWTFQLTFKDEKSQQAIKQFRYQKWQKKPSQQYIPSFLTLLQSVQIWQKESENAPILVHLVQALVLRDGVTKSGLFCVAWSILERLKVDQNVNILQTVRQMRNNRPEIITDLEQYRFLHQVALSYVESYQTYANFS
ncbi:receptor-type tyrosine-protein phosphatase kappa-like [Liolophura sinensis]|uniref:receptor-type tyrosine-protein phosphatase kappa-like n=1 Tax=Liolophura sinensis TaxID=3198878 RepID=UPI0031590438